MKRVLILFVLSFVFANSYSQIYQKPLLFGKEENRLQVWNSLAIPNDTVILEAKKPYPAIAVKDGVLYTWNVSLQKWNPATGDSTNNNYPTSLSFNTSNGVVTLGRNGLSSLTVDLDGRWALNSDAVKYSDSLTYYATQHDLDSVAKTIKTVINNIDSTTYSGGLEKVGNDVHALFASGIWNANRIQSHFVSAVTPGHGYFLGFDSVLGVWRPLKPDSVITAIGGINQSQLDDTAAAIRADFSTAGITNMNVGTGYRWLKPGSQAIKTAFNSWGVLLDSTSNTDGLTYKVDSSVVATKAFVNASIASAGGYTDEQAQDAIGAMVSSEFTYTDATPSLAINTIAQSKITGLSSSLAAKQNNITLTTTGTGAATLVGSTLNIPTPAGSTYTFSKGLTESGGAVSYGQSPVTVSDANYTVGSTDFFIKLPTITANRILTLPTASTNTGRHIVLWSANTSAFTWSFDVSTIGADGSTTNGSTMNNTSFLEIVSDGTNWVRSSGSGVTTRNNTGVVGVNQSELQFNPGTGMSATVNSTGTRTTVTYSMSGWVGSLSQPGDANVTWNSTITDIIYSTTLTANRTVTMGTASSGNLNRKVTIINSQGAAFNVLLSSVSGINFKGASFSTLAPGESVTLMSDNSTWQVVSYSTGK